MCKGRSGWLMPLGEALWENADLQLCIPMKFKRAPPLPPPPGPAMCTLLLDMLASNPDARPPADQLEARVRSALKEDSHWRKVRLRDHNGYNHYSHYMEILTAGPLTTALPTCVSNSHFAATGKWGSEICMIIWDCRCYFCHRNRGSIHKLCRKSHKGKMGLNYIRAPDCTADKTRNDIQTSPYRDLVGLAQAVFDVSTMLFLRPWMLDIENQFQCVYVAEMKCKGLLLLPFVLFCSVLVTPLSQLYFGVLILTWFVDFLLVDMCSEFFCARYLTQIFPPHIDVAWIQQFTGLPDVLNM